MELKTLKDILEMNGIDFEEGDWGEQMVDLRVEIIKFVKELQNTTKQIYCFKHGFSTITEKTRCDNDCIDIAEFPYESTDFEAVIKTLIYIFNITEEDLK